MMQLYAKTVTIIIIIVPVTGIETIVLKSVIPAFFTRIKK